MSASEEKQTAVAERRWFVRELVACGISFGDIARFLQVRPEVIASDRAYISDYDILTRDLPDRRVILAIIPIVQARLIELKKETAPENPKRHRKLIKYLERWLTRYARLIPQGSLYGLEISSLAKHLRRLGIPWQSIEDLTGVSHGTIRIYLKSAGHTKQLSIEAARVYDRRFETAFTEYAKTHFDDWVAPEGINDTDAYRDILARWLKVDEIQAQLHGYLQALNDQCTSNTDETYVSYQRLLHSLGAPKNTRKDVKQVAKTLWNDLLSLIAQENMPAPANAKGCQHYLQQHAREQMSYTPVPRVTHAIALLLDAAIAQLDGNYRTFICLRHGIGEQTPLSYQNIANQMGCTRQNVESGTHRAMQALHRMQEVKLALALMQPMDKLQQSLLEYEERIQDWHKREDESNKYPFDPWVLTQNPCNANLKLRTRNCLHAAKIFTVRALVLKTAPELMRLKGFGKLSLKDIEDYLEKMHLHLGMLETDLPPEGVF
jgi:DNA-directed RNA polymerase specialized sigma24 family protein